MNIEKHFQNNKFILKVLPNPIPYLNLVICKITKSWDKIKKLRLNLENKGQVKFEFVFKLVFWAFYFRDFFKFSFLGILK